jgi:hypothetical protein
MIAAPPVDPYKVLQVDRQASPEVIEAAYRRLAKMNHPDVSTAIDAGLRMKAINAAHELLEDAASRRSVDERLARPVVRDVPWVPTASPHPRPSKPLGYQPETVPGPAAALERRSPWYETVRQGHKSQRAIAIAGLLLVLSPMFDRGTQLSLARLVPLLAVWTGILIVQLWLSGAWRTTPLGSLLRLLGRSLGHLAPGWRTA